VQSLKVSTRDHAYQFREVSDDSETIFFCSRHADLDRVAVLASGHGYRLGNIRIVHPWAMPTAPSITDGANGAGYLVLKNNGRNPDKLLSASTEVAGKVELHARDKAGDTRTLRQTNAIEIAAGGEVRLEPGAVAPDPDWRQETAGGRAALSHHA
jgi:hypothetical protein